MNEEQIMEQVAVEEKPNENVNQQGLDSAVVEEPIETAENDTAAQPGEVDEQQEDNAEAVAAEVEEEKVAELEEAAEELVEEKKEKTADENVKEADEVAKDIPVLATSMDSTERVASPAEEAETGDAGTISTEKSVPPQVEEVEAAIDADHSAEHAPVTEEPAPAEPVEDQQPLQQAAVDSEADVAENEQQKPEKGAAAVAAAADEGAAEDTAVPEKVEDEAAPEKVEDEAAKGVDA
ncbi:unnamed protein product [Amoebophrya sp. A25]|nr:unnamed protein product [Amoebophrya sp. A25]|eukprot:GSA25T00011039001.1